MAGLEHIFIGNLERRLAAVGDEGEALARGADLEGAARRQHSGRPAPPPRRAGSAPRRLGGAGIGRPACAALSAFTA